MDYKVKIDEFEGPLDLLLHLIKESNIDIHDIKIDEITKQYLDYLKSMQEIDMEITSNYLVMASELMLIKSNSLLPNNKEIEIDEEEELSKESLINKLIEYQRYKELTKDFKNLELERKKIYTKAPSNINDITNQKFINNTNTTIDDLIDAFSKFLERKDKEKPINTKITNKEYSVKKRKTEIKKILKDKKKIEFSKLFNNYNKSFIIVTFISILELAKEKEIKINQKEDFKEIYIELM